MKTRYSKLKSTGRLLESQSGGDESNPQHLQTLIDNAISAGHNKEDIEAGYEDEEIVRGWLKDANEAVKTYKEKRKDEYPTIEELVVALYDTDDKAEIIKRRAEVKAKYPKE